MNLEFNGVGNGDVKSILVTGAIPGEGKTTTASNLAVSLARDGKSVVLIDADLRKPALHSVFQLDNSKGLSSVIMGDSSIEDVLSATDIENLKVISSGPLPPEPTVLLRSQRMRALLESISNHADVVMLDSPPVLSVTDSIVTAALVDSIILVLDAQRARRDAVKQAAQMLQQTGTPIVGAVFNKVSVRRGSGGGYGYGNDDNFNSRNGAGERSSSVMKHRVLTAAKWQFKRLKKTITRS